MERDALEGSMEIRYSKAAGKAIGEMDRPAKQRIKTAIEKLPDGDVKPLRGSKGTYRLRVGDRRILFSYPADDTILIEKIGPRGEVYKGG
ncbi:MAG: type II toxin-antitoxin system RelE/ParE family toxin [Oscillospiraceae bacterium]|nr:type II toxin-antitoxin system RelE/ParE family toxin [Oscillospiraceae bacterium]